MALSDAKLRALYGKPYNGPTELTDTDGLSIRITPRGVINFQFRYRWNGKQHRLGIGKYPAFTLRDARNIVADMKLSIDKGIDPKLISSRNKSLSSPTVGECLAYWMEYYVTPTLRLKTRQLYQSTVIKNLSGAFPGIPAENVPVKAWVELFAEQEKINQVRARQLLSQLRSAMGWCIRRQYLSECEVMKISPKDVGIKANVGETVLTYNQLAKIWLAIERSRASTANKLAHQLLMLYGARNSEVRESFLSEFDFNEGLWIVPSTRSKMGNVIRRPIFAEAESILKKAATVYGEVLFPGPNLRRHLSISAANRYIKRLQSTLDIGEFTAHDFRRSLATRLSEEGVAPHVIEKMLGHELGGVLTVYNKHDWLAEQKAAYELYASRIFEHVRKLSG
ncbi:integrase [Pantoea ananatis]|nr:integrase [Pantoea ananatis]